MNKVRVLLGDDHSFILGGVHRLLEHHYHVLGMAENGRLLVEMAKKLAPEVVVLDVSMPILNGIDAGREIKKVLPKVKLVFLSMHASGIYLRKAFQAGASAYVLKTGATEELLVAIEAARRGDSYVSPGFDTSIIDSIRGQSLQSKRATVELTSRQREILQLVAEGKQNKEIADILGVSVKTVEFHRGSLMTKLGAHSVAELTRFAIQEGLISPHE